MMAGDLTTLTAPPPDTVRGATKQAGIDWNRVYAAVGAPSRDKISDDDEKIASLEPKAPALTPMPPKEPQTDPLQAFGQPALWIAAIGGLLARQHLTAAIQSAGAVMNATHTQDAAITQRHYEEWKINTENAMKMAKYEQDAYKTALAKKSTDVREAEAEFRTVALAAKNAGAIRALQEGGLDGAARYVEAHRKGIRNIEQGAQDFSDHVDAQAKVAEGLGSDDPNKQADALDLYADQIDKAQKGKGSTSTSRMGTFTVGVRLKAIADALRSGDPEKMAAAQKEAATMPEIGPGVLKPPRVAPAQKPQFFVDADNTPFQVVTENGRATVLDMKGQPYTATTFSRPSTAEAPHVAERRDEDETRKQDSDAERARHDAEMEKIQNSREMSEDQRAAASLAERTRHDQEEERLRAEPKPQTTPWQVMTDPTTNQQFRARTNPEGKPEYQDMGGNTIAPPSGAAHIGAAPQPAIPQTQDQKDATAAMVASGMPLTQVIPGFGQAGIKERGEARNSAIDLIRKDDPSLSAADAGRELARRETLYVAQRSSALQLDKMLGATKQAVDQLEFNINRTKSELKKLSSSDISPIINAIARGEEKWAGDPAYSSLFYYMSATALESARILQGGQASAAQLHQGAADEASKWANMNMTPRSFDAVGDAMLAEGQKRVKTYEDALKYQTTMPGEHSVSSSLPLPTVEQNGKRVPDASKLVDHQEYILPDGTRARFDEKRMGFVPISE
jgi:hypothetical protein